jgi:probable addiction module antidote protein
MNTVLRYLTPDGRDIVGEWLASLRDVRRRQENTGRRYRARLGLSARFQGEDAMKNYEKASVSHDQAVTQDLRDDPELAAAYLQAASEDSEEPAVLLIALRRVVSAYGMQNVANQAGIKRESLYRALSAKGNPTVKTLAAVLKTVGLRLTVTTDDLRASA